LSFFALTLTTTPILNYSSAYAAEEIISQNIEPWFGDFEKMLERRQIRALVVYNKLMYFLDGAKQHGGSYESLQQLAKFIDKKYDLGARRMNIVYIPVTRDKIIQYLNDGIGDIAAANLTITPERLEHVDFSDPLGTGVSEVLVTGPSAPEITELADLSGKTIHVRESSSYYTHLNKINDQLKNNEMDLINLKLVDEYLEDGDLLEMINAGLLSMVFVDSHKADFWASIFPNLTVRKDIHLTVGGSIGWAYRKNSPTFGKILSQYIAANKKGTLIGNTIYNRYLKNNKWVKEAYSANDIKKLKALTGLFQQYGEQFGFDWLMLISLAYQESGLDQSVKSSSGALGVMQMLPTTAKDPNVAIDDIHELENNVHAGAKYLRFIRDRYFDDPEINELNQILLSFASYNAGPNRIASIRKETAESGLDPNVWFGNVEHIVAKNIGRETVQYVGNIYKYYIAYKLLDEQKGDRDSAIKSLTNELN
jgi:membrane-bound lytic murein transglycosylase MltF